MKTGMTFYAHCDGDYWAGISPMTAKIVFEDDCFWDQGMIDDTKQMLRDFYDTSDVSTEDEHLAQEKAIDYHIKQSNGRIRKRIKKYSAMKQYIILFLLILMTALSTKGQVTLIHIPFDSAGTYEDTISCMMLVTLDVDMDSSTRTTIFTIPYAYHIKGFEVCEKRDHDAEPFVYSGPRFYWSHVSYLDADKKPLAKTIIVWMSKTLKQ